MNKDVTIIGSPPFVAVDPVEKTSAWTDEDRAAEAEAVANAAAERRSDGLEELLAEVVRVLHAIFHKQREEVSRLAGIASSAAVSIERRMEALECELQEEKDA